jgi:23S rRNA (adenine-N6)-dimethyltransferase
VAGRRAPRARPSAPRSQHFLRSSGLAAELVASAGIGPGDLVVDVGAGTGVITSALARAAGRVVAVELDPRLAQRLRGRWPNVEVVEGDACGIPPPGEPFRVVANPPFSRTADLLHALLDDPATPLLRADLVLEWAVAHKHAVPWPSSLNGVLWGSTYEAGLARRLPRGAFSPAPSVDAGVLVVQRRAEALVPAELVGDYRRFVAAGFRRGVRAVVSRRELERVGAVGACVAARDLDAHQWAALFHQRAPSPRRRRRTGRG